MDEEDDDNVIPSSVKIYGGVLLIIVFIFGGIGNLLTILSITLYSKLCRKVIHILLLPISICGFIIDIICVPTLGLHVVHYWPIWPLSEGMCTVVSFLTNTCMSIMVATLLLFSIDRYYIVVRKKMISRRNVVLMLITFVIIASFLHGSYLFPSQQNQKMSIHNISVCNQLDGEVLDDDVRAPIVIATTIHSIIMLISVLLLGVSSCTWWKVKATELSSPLRSIGNDLKAASVIAAGCFGFWMPYWILLTFRTHKPTKVKLVVISFILSVVSTTIVPFTALMFLKTIRRAFVDILKGCKNTDPPCTNPLNKQDHDKDLLTQNPAVIRDHYDDIDAPRHKFVKGNFKRGTKRVTMDNVSIDSSEFSSADSQGHDNTSYDDLTELNPHMESRF